MTEQELNMRLEKCKTKLNEVFDFVQKEFRDPKDGRLFREKCYFAGGCIWSLVHGEKPNDYDIFCRDGDTAGKLALAFGFNHATDYSSENAVTFPVKIDGEDAKIQFICAFYGEPNDAIGQFDFQHNMYAYDGKGKFYAHKMFFCDGTFSADDDYLPLAGDALLRNPVNKGDLASVACRAVKFIRRGFVFGESDMADLLSDMVKQFAAKSKDGAEGDLARALIQRLGEISDETHYDEDSLMMNWCDDLDDCDLMDDIKAEPVAPKKPQS